MKVTVLVENTVYHGGLFAEHGLSLLIEVGERVILFDTGQSAAFLHNMERMEIDPAIVTDVIISHGHYDHAGGLAAFLETGSDARIILTRGMFARRYHVRQGQHRYIGMPEELRERLSSSDRVYFAHDVSQLADHIWIITDIPQRNPIETVDDPFVVFDEHDQEVPDDLNDEQALVIKTPSGLAVFTGCGHRGVINTLSYAVQAAGEDNIALVMGGFHLINASNQRINWTIDRMRDKQVDHVVPLHCTGPFARMQFYRTLGDRVHFYSTGERFEL